MTKKNHHLAPHTPRLFPRAPPHGARTSLPGVTSLAVISLVCVPYGHGGCGRPPWSAVPFLPPGQCDTVERLGFQLEPSPSSAVPFWDLDPSTEPPGNIKHDAGSNARDLEPRLRKAGPRGLNPCPSTTKCVTVSQFLPGAPLQGPRL